MAGGAPPGHVRHDQVRHVLLAEGVAGGAAARPRRARAPAHQHLLRGLRGGAVQRHRQPDRRAQSADAGEVDSVAGSML